MAHEHKHHHKPADAHLIAVIGATGAQGGSVVRSLLGKDGHHHRGGPWHVRALVRDPSTAEAKVLAGLGAEVVQCDYTHKDQLKHAFHGCHGVFAMTSGGHQETTIGRMMAAAAQEEKVEHFVWSGLEDADALTEGKYHVPHFTHKAKVEEHLRQSHGTMAWTSVYPAFFYSNIKNFYTPVAAADGSLEIKLPASGGHAFPYVDPATAVGPIVAEIFSDKSKYQSKVVPIIGEEISHNDICAALSRAWGKHVRFVRVSADDWVSAHSQNPMARELANMWLYAEEFGYYSRERDTRLSRKLDTQALTFDGWLQRARWHL